MSSVLLVDDEACFRKYVRAGLEEHGIKVYEADCAADAERLLENASVDLLVVDVVLGPRESGFDLVKRVKGRCPETGIVLISGSTRADYRQQSRTLGVFDFVEKPFHISAIEDRLSRFKSSRAFEQKVDELQREMLHVVPGSALDVWPMAYISHAGRVLFATPPGRVALQACADPALPSPLRYVDGGLLETFVEALYGSGLAMAFRRDDVLSHYDVYVREVSWNGDRAIALFFAGAHEQRIGDRQLEFANLLTGAMRSRGS